MQTAIKWNSLLVSFSTFHQDCWTILCRGRKKKIVILTIVFIILLNAMFYIYLQLYRLRHKKHIKRLGADTYVDEKGMRVVVGHYLGGYSEGNVPNEIINSNNYAPVAGAGDEGRPVYLSPREVITAKELFHLHFYNILVSDRIPINRTLKDVRSESCKSTVYNTDNLPTASVVIVFHNEAWSALMRTIMSVLLRSPDALLKEVILVDDVSDRTYLGKELEDAIAKLDKVKLLRSPERKGLVNARLIGAKAAAGDVLVFLDAHCEVTPGWLEPLLDRAGSDDVFICPFIDLISDDTLAYIKSITGNWGGFNWRLHFRWFLYDRPIDLSKPYPTPAMAGGLFAVRKSLFWRLGGYDEGMLIWGAENIELSWRAWQCGARVEITACSRVGHIFRKNSPHSGSISTAFTANLARAAAVWMDEWADFFFKFNAHAAEFRDKQNVSDRITLRRSLNCKSFSWYLENVWPNHFFPTSETWFGRIRNDRGACLGFTPGPPGLGRSAVGVKCKDDWSLDTMLIYTPDGRIKADEGLCLEQDETHTVWRGCSQNNRKQIWEQRGPRLRTVTKFCLTLVRSNKSMDGVGETLTGKRCLDTPEQIWHFDKVPWR